MARPRHRRAPARSAPPALVDLAIGLLVGHCVHRRDEAPVWRFGPIVLVSPAEDAATAAVRAACATREWACASRNALLWNGRSLDRELAAALAGDRLDRLAAALANRRLVVVDRIDRVTHPERQQALVHLLDTTSATGTAWCVSVSRHPAKDMLPQAVSRLGGGLVVPAATPLTGPLPTGTAPTLARVIRVAARHHDIAPAAVTGPSRSRTVAAARSLAMYLARHLTGRSFQAIGDACGDRDHTTVLHGVRVCATRIARDPGFAADVDRLAAELRGPASSGSPAPGRRRSGVGAAALVDPSSTRRRPRPRAAAVTTRTTRGISPRRARQSGVR